MARPHAEPVLDESERTIEFGCRSGRVHAVHDRVAVRVALDAEVAGAHRVAQPLPTGGSRSPGERFAGLDEVCGEVQRGRDPVLDEDRDERDVTAFENLLLEAELWNRLIAQATVLVMDETEFDGTVSLGVRVRLRMPEGELWVVPVHPAEAFLDDERVSVESPLGSALMGKRPGDIVEIAAPRGSWQATIVETEPSLLVRK